METSEARKTLKGPLKKQKSYSKALESSSAKRTLHLAQQQSDDQRGENYESWANYTEMPH